MRADFALAVFNRGRVSKRTLGRIDVDRIALSAEVQTNWMPRTLGPMSLRPGFGYTGANPDDGAYIPFIYTNTDNAILELTPDTLRIWDTGDTLVQRTGVATTVTNGEFTTDLTGWTDADEGAVASSVWSGAGGTFLQMIGTGDERAIRRQTLTVAGGEINTEHALRIVINRGPVLLRIGTAAGSDDIFRQAVLRTGTHSIAFTPGVVDPVVELSTSNEFNVRVDSIQIEAGGIMTLPTPWDDADACKAVRWDQSGDVVYLASDVQQRRIERRPNNSWSVVLYQSDDGPFLTENTTAITLTPSALTGSITLTASQPIFQATHGGSLWRITSVGQTVEASLSAQNTFSDPILVTGVGTSRVLEIVRSNTWTATLTLQRSIAEPGTWVDVKTYTTNGTDSFNDGFDNSDIYYRVGIKTGDYTSGTVDLSLAFPSGSITGVIRILTPASQVVCTAVVVKALGGLDPSNIWAEGAWSSVRGWPTAVALYQGRLWWSGNGRIWGSVSDNFTGFSPDADGDSAPINRTVGDGPVNRVNWLLPMERLMAGTDLREQSIRSNSFDEPITPTNYNSKATSTKGSATIPAALSNAVGFFVGKNTTDVYELRWSGEDYSYKPVKATLLVPDIAEMGFARIAIQEEPDVRLHCVKTDGTAAVLVRDQAEDVLAWVDIETDGFIEDVCVLPGVIEDRVFYRVRRVIDGNTVRYHEEWARMDQCRGGTQNLQGDSFVTGSGPITTITGLDHLEGETVVCWADGVDQGNFTVTGGEFTLPGSVNSYMVGLGYTADYKGAKLAVQTQIGLDLNRRKRAVSLGLLLADTHYQGLKYGPSFDELDDLPLTENDLETPADTVWDCYDEDHIEFPGDWDTDSRICLRAAAPRPCTVMAAMISVDRQTK